MPIKISDISTISQQEFYAIDYRVMEMAFEMHNALGCCFFEDVYRNELANCCKLEFKSVDVEVPIAVEYRDYSKVYFIDLLINRSVIYELKAVSAFSGSHRLQLLNYILLCGLQHGKLLNFRTPKIGCEFVSTSLNIQERYKYRLICEQWREWSGNCSLLKSTMEALLQEWGVFWEVSLFSDALIHFLGGADKVVQMRDICYKGAVIGHLKVNMLNQATAFVVTAFKNKVIYQNHLKGLLEKTDIECIQWINLNKHDVEFITIF